jgi:hypothetical protein
MTYRSAAGMPLGYPLPGTIDTNTTPLVPVGTIAKFYDDTMGEGEFIYLPGVASTAAGDAVVYDLNPGAQATTRLVNNAQNNTGRPVAFATAATVAASYGWYQIGGLATVNAVAAVAAGRMFASATTGSIDNTADAGDQILNARVSSAVGTPAANKSYATLNRPCMQSQIT